MQPRTRCFNLPSAAIAANAGMLLSRIDASVKLVIPNDSIWLVDSVSAVRLAASEGSGTMFSTSAVALCSRNTPLGSPAASCSITPPAGVGVARVTFASFSAAEFTQTLWCASSLSSTGLWGATASRNFAFCSPGANTAPTQLPPTIQSPGLARAAQALTAAAIAAGLAPGAKPQENCSSPANST